MTLKSGLIHKESNESQYFGTKSAAAYDPATVVRTSSTVTAWSAGGVATPGPSIGFTPTPEPMVTAEECAGEIAAAQQACQAASFAIGTAAGAFLTWLFMKGSNR